MRKVLVAYDGSEGAKKALAAAADLDGADLTILSVVPIAYSGRGGGIDPSSNVGDHRLELEEATAWLAEQRREAKTIEVIGDPADSIVTAAESGGHDLIVMGSRGLSAVQRFLVGSTAARVVAHAPCSVLVVR